jgi:hypothetical protein
MPGSLDDLDLLLVMVAKPRMVHRDGIHFQGLRYLAPALAAYIREPVTIRYDPRDITEIRVFHRNRSSAGRSVPSTPARPSPSKTSRPRVQRTAGPCAARSTSGSPGSPTSCPAPPLTRRRSSPRRSHGGQLPGCAPISKTPDDRQPPPSPGPRPSSPPRNTADSRNSPAPSAATATSACATTRPESARRSQPAATHDGTWLSRCCSPGDRARTPTRRHTPPWPAPAPSSTPPPSAAPCANCGRNSNC